MRRQGRLLSAFDYTPVVLRTPPKAVTSSPAPSREKGFVPNPPPEEMDGDHLSYEKTRRALRDLRRVNRWLWGYPSVVRSLLPRLRPGQRILDVGTGSGDVAAAVQRAAARKGVDLSVIGVDFKLRHLAVGRSWHPGQLRVVASADALPFASGAVHHAFSSLFFHHFGSDSNRAIVGEMRRVASQGVVVVDLRRSLILRLAIGPLLRLVGAGSIARNDGHLSVRCAWSLAQVRTCQLHDLGRLRRRFPFRFALTLPAAKPPRQTLP